MKPNIDDLNHEVIVTQEKAKEAFDNFISGIYEEAKRLKVPCNGVKIGYDRDYRIKIINKIKEAQEFELIEEAKREKNYAVYHEMKEGVL